MKSQLGKRKYTTIQPKKVFTLKEDRTYDITFEYWDFPHWEEYQQELYYRVLVTDGDDSMCHKFYKTEEEAHKDITILSDLNSMEEVYFFCKELEFDYW